MCDRTLHKIWHLFVIIVIILDCNFLRYLLFLQARLRLAEVVEKEDVNEAMRLMEMSKDSLNPSVEHGRFVIFFRFYLLVIEIK